MRPLGTLRISHSYWAISIGPWRPVKWHDLGWRSKRIFRRKLQNLLDVFSVKQRNHRRISDHLHHNIAVLFVQISVIFMKLAHIFEPRVPFCAEKRQSNRTGDIQCVVVMSRAKRQRIQHVVPLKRLFVFKCVKKEENDDEVEQQHRQERHHISQLLCLQSTTKKKHQILTFTDFRNFIHERNFNCLHLITSNERKRMKRALERVGKQSFFRAKNHRVSIIKVIVSCFVLSDSKVTCVKLSVFISTDPIFESFGSFFRIAWSQRAYFWFFHFRNGLVTNFDFVMIDRDTLSGFFFSFRFLFAAKSGINESVDCAWERDAKLISSNWARQGGITPFLEKFDRITFLSTFSWSCSEVCEFYAFKFLRYIFK